MRDKLPVRASGQRVQRMIEEMVAAEERHLAERKAEECECREGMFPTRVPTSRRAFLFAAGSTTGAAAAAVLSKAA
jgi:sulfane dehydrogenase subunit SoxC